MKSISFSLVILALLTFSCTADTINSEATSTTVLLEKKLKKAVSLEEDRTAENPANVYDFAGKLHNDILDVYLTDNYQFTTVSLISQQIMAIVNSNVEFEHLSLDINQSACLTTCQDIVDNPQIKFDEAIANSSLSTAAKVSFSSFMDSLLIVKNDDFGVIYQFIISYESGVIANTQFSAEDKRIILITSSIARFSLYYEKRRKDKDWESSVGNRAGAFSGAIHNVDSAIGRSLVTGIMTNVLVVN